MARSKKGQKRVKRPLPFVLGRSRITLTPSRESCQGGEHLTRRSPLSERGLNAGEGSCAEEHTEHIISGGMHAPSCKGGRESETARGPSARRRHCTRREWEKVGGMNGNCSHLEAPQTAAVVGSAEVEIL